jgi:hypothetical protein
VVGIFVRSFQEIIGTERRPKPTPRTIPPKSF